MEVKLIVNGKEFSIGSQILESISSGINDHANYQALMEAMAEAGNVQVRRNLAYKDNINERTVEILSEKYDAETMRNLFRNKTFKETASQDLIDKMIELGDYEILENLAGSVGEFTQIEGEAVMGKLAKHPEPGIRKALVSNFHVPKSLKKNMLKDSDPDVVIAAMQGIE